MVLVLCPRNHVETNVFQSLGAIIAGLTAMGSVKEQTLHAMEPARMEGLLVVTNVSRIHTLITTDFAMGCVLLRTLHATVLVSMENFSVGTLVSLTINLERL